MQKDSGFDNSVIAILIPIFQQLSHDYIRCYAREEGEDEGTLTIFAVESLSLAFGYELPPGPVMF